MTHRWIAALLVSTYLCHAQGIDCTDPASVPAGYAECCNPAVAKTIQERAWSSPVWYRPEGVTHVRGRVQFKDLPQHDVLSLEVDLGGMPAGLDPSTQDVTIAVRDDDDVFRVTIPAGTLRQVGANRFTWSDPSGSLGGLRTLRLQPRGSRGVALRLRTVPMDLAAADRTDHFVEVSLHAGTASLGTTQLWRAGTKSLAVRN